ncbi:arrestin domain-containing protein 17-like isoform X3 [Myzus persicae]|uniref:arrestin domain-containing protein 17-like isoform X3 n=1 Tax=Myzus persicae TaxID=13164 RepID=UPI000B937A12|nr:arrestin domain-containing protein 17-like isoform X3 [Myzus persicae]
MNVDDDALLIFDEPTATFMPGQTITGRVVFLTRSPMKKISVTIQFRGECKLSWTKWESRCIGKKLFLKSKIVLFCDKGESQLEVSKYVYPFHFSLPSFIPSTFFCKYGCIRYTAKAKIIRPRRPDVIMTLMFVILSPIDLNDVPSTYDPQCALKENPYRSSCLISGSIKLLAYIPYSGFVPGQTIPVTVKLDNKSNKWKINAHYTSSRKSDIVRKIINGAEKHTTKTYVVQIQIPNSLMILDFKYCKVITETFTLHVEALGSDVRRVAFNVLLGNIPLITTARDTYQDNQTFQLSVQKYCSYKSIPTNYFPFVD